MSKTLTLFLTFLLLFVGACTSHTKSSIGSSVANSGSGVATNPPVIPNPPAPTPTPDPVTCVINSVTAPTNYGTVSLSSASMESPLTFVSMGNLQSAVAKIRGIGLEVQNQGWRTSHFIDRRVGFVNRLYSMDFSADPFQMSGGPDALDLARADVKAAFNRRYGPAPDGQITESSCGHETSFAWWDAAVWKFNTNPTQITPNPQAYDGVLTLKEKMDLVYTCQLQWIHERCYAEGSCNKDYAIEIQDPNKPCGYFQAKNFFWGYYDWFHNTSPTCRTTCP